MYTHTQSAQSKLLYPNLEASFNISRENILFYSLCQSGGSGRQPQSGTCITLPYIKLLFKNVQSKPPPFFLSFCGLSVLVHYIF